MNAFDCLSLPQRPAKPRDIGLTMVLDSRHGVDSLEELLSVASDYIDFYKFGWGTSRVCPRDRVIEKLELLKHHDVKSFPGGTLFEIAYAQKRVAEFLAEAAALGFTAIEVSDGTVQMPHSDKLDLIRRASDAGFTVISEVGRKFPIEDRHYSIEERSENARRELETGAVKVIIEARESGKLGIFDEQGEIIASQLDHLLKQVGLRNAIFEAPIPRQQEWLILNLGNTVNLGNIATSDVVNLETLRCGLRAGTLRDYHLDHVSVFIEQGVSGAMHAAALGHVIIVVDALRASSTIIAALSHGAASVRNVTSADECTGEVTAGERGGHKIPHLDYDNSPLQIINGDITGKQLVLTTTNGSECIKASTSQQSPVLIGAMLNARAVASRALEIARAESKDITILMAGRNDQLAMEDLLSASEIANHLKDCSLKGHIRPTFSTDCVREFLESDSGRNLSSLGLRDEVAFCAQQDASDVVPQYDYASGCLIDPARGMDALERRDRIKAV